MREGGKILSEVLAAIVEKVSPGVRFEELEKTAQAELKKRGAAPSFSTVSGYSWATCITKNEGCCHGIPKGKTVEAGDLITVDVGALYQGYHTDTSFTLCVGDCTLDQQRFLKAGKQALQAALSRVMPGNTVYHVSRAMQEEVEKAGFQAIYQLTGHGIGQKLHEAPNVPCYADERSKRDILTEGQTLAIEIMYAKGNPKLVLDTDGWTYRTEDGSPTGMFEKTIIVTKKGAEALTHFPLEKGGLI